MPAQPRVTRARNHQAILFFPFIAYRIQESFFRPRRFLHWLSSDSAKVRQNRFPFSFLSTAYMGLQSSGFKSTYSPGERPSSWILSISNGAMVEFDRPLPVCCSQGIDYFPAKSAHNLIDLLKNRGSKLKFCKKWKPRTTQSGVSSFRVAVALPWLRFNDNRVPSQHARSLKKIP